MKKNAFLTFIFACIPGAGQMYYGYMKRGLSMITFFCLFIMAGTLVDVLVVGSIIVWISSPITVSHCMVIVLRSRSGRVYASR